MEAWPSGLRRLFAKQVGSIAHEGSNPSASAKQLEMTILLTEEQLSKLIVEELGVADEVTKASKIIYDIIKKTEDENE